MVFVLFSVWHLQTGKCIRTFKHKYPVTVTALDEDYCIAGDEGIPGREDSSGRDVKGGEVRVWNMKNGDLIKVCKTY